jgi:hypothetical protein
LSWIVRHSARLGGDFVEGPGEIAGLIHEIDEILPNEPVARIGDEQRHLLGQMTGEGGLRRQKGFHIVVAVFPRSAPHACPFRGHSQVRGRTTPDCVIREDIFQARIEPLFDGGAAGFELLAEPVAALGRALGFRLRFVAALGFTLIRPFEQWVTLKLGVHMGDQVEVGQL